jgi:hypothetical protein
MVGGTDAGVIDQAMADLRPEVIGDETFYLSVVDDLLRRDVRWTARSSHLPARRYRRIGL